MDNQSDPISPNFDLPIDIGNTDQRIKPQVAAFTRQFDSSLDFGLSDFHQRHNLVMYLTAALPSRRFLRNWRVSGVAAVRSGFPYNLSITSSVPEPGRDFLLNVQPLLVRESPFMDPPVPVPGGERVLDRAAFVNPPAGEPGMRRNTLIAAGAWNADLSISRSFVFENWRLEARVDSFNAFNHTNFDFPQASLDAADFGIASKGRIGLGSLIPSLVPLQELPRRIQLQLKFYF